MHTEEAALERLAAALDDGGGEVRAGQIAMAQAVGRAVRDERPLVVRAGTGTGKTWAYLVGALLGSDESRVVVATATKALQDQLAGKDLPAVAAAGIRPDLTWAVLKGRSNYLCRQAAAEVAREDDAPSLALEGAEGGRTNRVGREVADLLVWAEKSESGDRAELDFEPGPAAWSSVSVGSDQCPGAQQCPSGQTCFAEAAYQRARDADVIIVNLHLLGAHVASGGYVLPDHDVLIVDEAHEAPEVMGSALGVTLTPGRVAAVARLTSAPGLVGHGATIDRVLTPLMGSRLAASASGDASVAEALGNLSQELRRQRSALRDLEADPAHKARRERAAKAVDSLATDIETVLHGDDDMVTWVEQSGSQPALRVAPVDVGAALARVAWSAATPILTSATIPPGLGQRLGLGGDAVDLDVGSPFDYRRCALLYVPRLVDPRHPDHEAAAHAELEFLATAAGGRTLALFTSWRAMRAAHAALSERLPYRVLAQDDLPKPALLDLFRADETSCLFATMGFWQGVDVPGRACTLVVIDRLPFPRPDDPVVAARRERAGGAAFATVDLPHVATRLAQGAGRLIRSGTDRGVVAVLDPRLAESSYRPTILAALPPMRRTRDRADVTAFFAAAP
ncbi:MAG TPA: ATP-dependent DNA helicase [Acidimicrobiales bacterium]|nr:ATP-dependent DNA helicase [Acidimicrobiales bacterium]